MAPKKHNPRKRQTARAPAARRARARAQPVLRSVRAGGSEAAYVKALFDPFAAAPTRYPDMLAQGTSVTSSTLRYTVAGIVDGVRTTQAYVAVTTFPHVGSTLYGITPVATAAAASKLVIGNVFSAGTTPASPGNFVYVADPLHGDVANSGAAYANMSSYRTVGMGVRVRNLTPLLNRGGLCGFRSVVGRQGDSVEIVNVDAVLGNRNTTVFDAASLGEDGEYYAWLPNNYTDLSFQFCSDTNYTPALQFVWSGPASTQQTFEIEVRTLYEFRPIEAVQYLFDQSVALGSPMKVEALVAEVIQRTGEDPSTPGFFQRATRAADAVLDVPGVAVEAARHLTREARHAASRVLQPFR